MKLPSAMRLKETRRVPMWNGPIECRLFRFDLVAGSAREPATGAELRRRSRRAEPGQHGERCGIGAQDARAEADAAKAARDARRFLAGG